MQNALLLTSVLMFTFKSATGPDGVGSATVGAVRQLRLHLGPPHPHHAGDAGHQAARHHGRRRKPRQGQNLDLNKY